jgi:hypothetical protein
MNELEVLGIVSERLSAAGLEFMLSGSFALAYYATPRMTRDIDIVVALRAPDAGRLVAAFAQDFYVDADAVKAAVQSERLFNMMHLQSGIKVDLIIRKSEAYRRIEFERRRKVSLAGMETWIVSREDLILSKLAWAKPTGSEMQLRDVKALLGASVDMNYLLQWADVLDVRSELERLMA